MAEVTEKGPSPTRPYNGILKCHKELEAGEKVIRAAIYVYIWDAAPKVCILVASDTRMSSGDSTVSPQMFVCVLH